MPRILPRLLKKIQQQGRGQAAFLPYPRPPKRRKSLHSPPLSRPSFRPEDHPRSIVLTSRNPVVNAKEYVRNKTLPPTLCRPVTVDGQNDPPRQMTDAEFGWWANPYLRMLTSPLRTCVVTKHVLPTDFLVRLVGMRIPNSRFRPHPTGVIAPDGLLSPKYTNRYRSGGGMYVLCWREAVSALKKNMKGLKLAPSPRLADYIAHLLRLRVVQEFELLAERLEYAVRSGKNRRTSSVILRRLTRDEWLAVKCTKSAPYENGVAILVVPPLKKDPATKERPRASLSALPPTDERPFETSLPVSTLLPVSSQLANANLPTSLPLPYIPLYNGVTAFPSRSQRSALHGILLRILKAERFIKYLYHQQESSKSSKASHAFLLCSDEATARRGDASGIARALWRLRMYEGSGWQDVEE